LLSAQDLFQQFRWLRWLRWLCWLAGWDADPAGKCLRRNRRERVTTAFVRKNSWGRFAFAALLGFAPVLARLSEVGPSATAFYRILIALPVLWIWMRFESPERGANEIAANANQAATRQNAGAGPSSASRLRHWLFVLAGFCFAADLAFWHWSIKFTTVANATLLSNLAPLFVTLGACFLFAERITPFSAAGMLFAFLGGSLLVGGSLKLAPEHMLGDFLGFVTALFYASYLLTVKCLRQFYATARVLFWSGVVSCIVLLPVAVLSGEKVVAASTYGWTVLVILGLLSHVGGQGLITFALAHLPASLTAVSLLFQPVVAALLAWVILAEKLGLQEVIGGMIILSGIALAGRPLPKKAS